MADAMLTSLRNRNLAQQLDYSRFVSHRIDNWFSCCCSRGSEASTAVARWFLSSVQPQPTFTDRAVVVRVLC